MDSQTAKEYYGRDGHYLTVGRLKELLKDYPDDALVVSQRVEDVYYEEHGWQTIDKPDPVCLGFNQQYSPVWGACFYEGDQNCLFLDLHY
jgi:hypothetical protein